ncbi:MAG TPA: sugar ABC transporter substrate-binding protein [Planctomycetota bacterium]|nr:sugar ABC transporter substrate-binding protein [Planctomycetota bacterium]HRR80075.1 sugar ABC transporter substrate-binding protein [Planctomycetota bacterium]HRT93036.1 sugar ABC transporter substrate-binding protein [Planctomycetota bacterium]
MIKRIVSHRVAGGWCALAAACLLGGCGGGDDAPPPAGQPKRVALVMKSLANEFFKTMEEGARKHQQKDPTRYELISNGIKDERDVAAQVALVEQMIAQKVNALVIAPADSKALVPVCKKAKDAGIEVVNIDNKFDDEALEEKAVKIPFVGPDNRKGARMAGEYLAKKLKPGDEVAILEGMPNAVNGIMRKLGFEAAMDAAGMKIVAKQTANWHMDEAEKVTSGLLAQHPNLKAILCANDNMALGAVAALRAAGKLGSVLVVGYDNIEAVQKEILAGNILCTVDQHADQIAVEGIRHALDILGGHLTPEASDYKETQVDLITADDLKKQAERKAPTETK